MQAAANLLQQAFNDNITVNIGVGYGEQNGVPLANQNSAVGQAPETLISYSQLRSDLISVATSPDDFTSTGAMPNTSSLGGQSQFDISRTQGKLFGSVAANDTTIDGNVYIGTGLMGQVLLTVALNELTAVMGREAGTPSNPSSMEIFRYSAPGVNVFGITTPQPPSYFSIDGGVTTLADFGQNANPGDFLAPPASTRTPNDPFDEQVNNLGFLTGLDQQVMDVLGFHRTSLAAIDQPPLLSGVPSALTYVGGRALTLAPSLTVSDVDGTTLASARVAFVQGWSPNQGDGIFVDTSGTNITAGYNPATGVLFLSGTDTIAHYNHVLDGLLFFLSGNNPTSSGANPTLAIGWQVSDGTATSNFSVTNVTIAPALVGTAGNDSYTAPAGDERIDGRGGIDTITFNFKLTDAHIGFAGGQVIVDGPNGASHTV